MNNEMLSELNEIPDFWREFGFEPWAWENMRGVCRRVTFRKDSLLGEIASYFVDDYIIWSYRQVDAADYILTHWTAAEDVMTHRFLVLGDVSDTRPRSRSFMFGLKGWLEIFTYALNDAQTVQIKKFEDLIFLANNGLKYAMRQGGEKGI